MPHKKSRRRVSALGRPEREHRSAEREGIPVCALGRPEHEGSTVNGAGLAAVLSLAGVVAFSALDARAEVFKCAGPGNVPIYQDTPCPAGRELRNFQTNPPEITILPAPQLPADPRSVPETQRGAKEAAAAKPAPAAGGDAALAADAAQRRFLRPGMTEGEVIARLGRPEVTSRGATGKATRWTYLPAARDPETITIIHFADGVITNVERKVSKR
jgi:hypothetical protein